MIDIISNMAKSTCPRFEFEFRWIKPHSMS